MRSFQPTGLRWIQFLAGFALLWQRFLDELLKGQSWRLFGRDCCHRRDCRFAGSSSSSEKNGPEMVVFYVAFYSLKRLIKGINDESVTVPVGNFRTWLLCFITSSTSEMVFLETLYCLCYSCKSHTVIVKRVLLRPTSEIFAVQPRAPEVAVHSAHRIGTGVTLCSFCSYLHNPGLCILGGWPLCVEWASSVAKIAP